MSRKEFLKSFKKLLMVMLITLPVLIVLNMFCFKGLSNGLTIFLDVIISLVLIALIEFVWYKIKNNKNNK